MAKTLLFRARVDAARKRAAERILGRMGISAGQFVEMAFAQVTLRNGVPFPLAALPTDDGHLPHQPNAETEAAMRERPRRSFATAAALLAHLDKRAR